MEDSPTTAKQASSKPWYVYWTEEGVTTRFPSQFANKEAANAFVFQRKQLPGWRDVVYEIKQDDPEADLIKAKEFEDA